MIRFQALGLRVAIPLPLLLVPFLANYLGLHISMPGIIFALGIHEAAHVLAARLAGVRITEILILPFGGSARMENPYGVSPLRMVVTAAAGPTANLLLALTMASLAQWRLVQSHAAAIHVRHNIALMAFNLIPALPLDGGRMLYALLQRPFGETCAQRIGIYCGRLLSAILVFAAVYAGTRTGKWNLSFLLAAVFIIASEEQEARALVQIRAQRLQNAFNRERIRPARIYHMDETLPVHQAIRLMRTWENTWFVLTRDGLPCSVVDDQSLLRQVRSEASADAPLRSLHPAEILRNTVSPQT